MKKVLISGTPCMNKKKLQPLGLEIGTIHRLTQISTDFYIFELRKYSVNKRKIFAYKIYNLWKSVPICGLKIYLLSIASM